MINNRLRYQSGMVMADLFQTDGITCACGCGNPLTGRKKKWYSAQCQEKAYHAFAVRKGDISVIRRLLFNIDKGACRECGAITDNWEADHIHPVSKGGGGCDISNFQTLCQDCHRQKTLLQRHRAAISSHADSILLIRSFVDVGDCIKRFLNASNDRQSLSVTLKPEYSGRLSK